MNVSVTTATDADAAEIASLRTAVASHLTVNHGRGHWSSAVTEKSVLRSIRTSRVLLARYDTGIVATLRLATKKPWAIDPAYFVSVPRPLYLLDMAVAPDWQRQGVGRQILEEAKILARSWPADALRLDAYAGPAGGGGFYAKCGFSEVGQVTYRGVPLIYFELLL